MEPRREGIPASASELVDSELLSFLGLFSLSAHQNRLAITYNSSLIVLIRPIILDVEEALVPHIRLVLCVVDVALSDLVK